MFDFFHKIPLPQIMRIVPELRHLRGKVFLQHESAVKKHRIFRPHFSASSTQFFLTKARKIK